MSRATALSLGDAGRAYVADHLVRTRRYRVAGVIGAFVVIAMVSAPAGSIRWDLDTVAAGWLLGAAAAESALARRSTRPARRTVGAALADRGAVRRRRRSVSLAGIALYQVEAGHVVRWTFLALLVLGVTARAVMVAEDRGSPDDADARSADRAVRADSVATITAVGTAVAIAFEFRADASVRPVDANDGGLGLIWLIGVVAILVDDHPRGALVDASGGRPAAPAGGPVARGDHGAGRGDGRLLRDAVVA